MIIITSEQRKDFYRFTSMLHDEYSLAHFNYCCVEEFRRILGVDWVSLSMNNKQMEIQQVEVTADYYDTVMQYASALDETRESHPVVSHLDLLNLNGELRGIHMSSDYVSERELRDLAVYQEAYRHLGVKHQILAELDFTPNLRTMLAINSGGEMGKEQRFLTEMMIPHLVLAYRNYLKYSKPMPIFSVNDPRNDLLDELSPRLQEVLLLLVAGLSRKLIAGRMNLSRHTVNDYIKEIYAKYHVHSHAELLALFVGNDPFSLNS
ncbi:helix-turn-helix transcriptional regulator [Kiritimatiellota bacterium B12222]|nr:helix-turn-helix transcriptional regulator [Kiritimatiellota bacterium B12222]